MRIIKHTRGGHFEKWVLKVMNFVLLRHWESHHSWGEVEAGGMKERCVEDDEFSDYNGTRNCGEDLWMHLFVSRALLLSFSS
jgi:hypothetical protein